MASVPVINPTINQGIVPRILPVVALFSLGLVVLVDTIGSIGINTGPTTGQISPRP